MLLWLSRGCSDCLVDLSSGVALEASDDVLGGFLFGRAARLIGAGAVVVSEATQGDAVERRVGVAVSSPVEPVTVGLARGRWDRGDSAQVSERS